MHLKGLVFPYHKPVVALLVREYPPPDSYGRRHGLKFQVVARMKPVKQTVTFGRLNNNKKCNCYCKTECMCLKVIASNSSLIFVLSSMATVEG